MRLFGWVLAVVLSACGSSDELAPAPVFAPDARAPREAGELPVFGTPGREVVDPFAGSCASNTIRPERVPLDLIFMIDTSGSMADATPGGTSKWDAVRAAFTSFARAAESDGVSAALHFFPQVQPNVPAECTTPAQCGAFGPCETFKACAGSSTLPSCTTDADCGTLGPCAPLGRCGAQPAFCVPVGERCSSQSGDVCRALPGRCAGRDICAPETYAQAGSPLVALPAGASTLLGLLADKSPEGMTPTGPALEGALTRARSQVANTPGRRAAVVLATDGFPTNCSPRGIAEIAAVAAGALATSPPIPTFVIGVFTPEESSDASLNLSRIAQAGGSGKPTVVSTSGNVSQGFLAALNDIRAAALACAYQIPKAERGQIDLQQVNVRFLTGANAYLTIGQVPAPAACNPSKGGWYYTLDATTQQPTGITVCPTTCDLFRADPRGRVDLILGCQTVQVD